MQGEADVGQPQSYDPSATEDSPPSSGIFEEVEELEAENVSTEQEDDSDVLAFPVQRKSLPSFVGESISNPYFLLINQNLGQLSIIKKGKWNRRYDVKLIEKLELACENARLLHIEWKKELAQDLSPQSRLPVHKRHSYIFSSAHERQQFYEASLYAMFKRGCLSVPPLDITEGKSLYREKISIFIGTWNMGLAPPPASLAAWIPRDKHDLYFIGFQESAWTSGAKIPQTQMLSYMWDTQEQEVLFDGIQKLLGPAYVRYAHRSLWQMRYVLFVRSEHVSSISNLQGNMFTTGVGGIVGDKGAMAISLQFNHTSFCFLTCHLAPHEEAFATRNAHFQAIAHGLQLGTQEVPCDLTNRFDYLFWTGDINYRLSLPRDKVLELIERRDWEALKKHDQLLNEKAKGNCFVGFQEGDLNFPPTYRYNRGDRTYSTEKMRTPSWTDRVLWKCLPGLKAKLTAYGCCDDITTSDHSSVYATFEVDTLRLIPTLPMPREIPVKYTIVITDLWAKGLIHKFEVKRIEDEMKRRDEERKRRIQKMAEQAKQPPVASSTASASADGGMLGQVGNWWSSLWGGKPAGNAPQRMDLNLTVGETHASGDDSQAKPTESRRAQGSPRGEGCDGDASTVGPKGEGDDVEVENELTGERRDRDDGAEGCATDEGAADEKSGTVIGGEVPDEREGGGKQAENEKSDNNDEEEDDEESLVKRNAFVGPAMYIREEEVPIAPYICFSGSFLDGVKRTPCVGHTRNPVWRDGEVPRLRPFISSKEWLSLQYLTLVVRDESFWSSSYEDMGQAVIPLKEVCGDRPVPFSMPLLYEGKPQGVVSGKIQIVVDGMQVSPPTTQVSPRYLGSTSAGPGVPRGSNGPSSSFTSSTPFTTSPLAQRAHTTSSSFLPISVSVPASSHGLADTQEQPGSLGAGDISPSYLPSPSPPPSPAAGDITPVTRKRSSSNPTTHKSTYRITELVSAPEQARRSDP